MKNILRVLLVFVSFSTAYFVAMYAERFTGVPLGDGQTEGTPLTEVAFFTVFPLTLVVVLVFGNMLITRNFRSQNQK